MIYYPKVYGTCFGALRAIKLAYSLKKEHNDKNIYIYKEILHNTYVINELEKDNIKTIDNLDNLTKDDIIIIRAHGEPKSVFDYLDQKGITYYDATCINVSKIHEIVKDKYKKGYKIIIIGKKNHPEVIGTNGWCHNNAILIEDENDYSLLNKDDNYYVVCQTTISSNKVNDVIKYLDENGYKYTFNNTICNQQELIQKSSMDLASDMDYMFVIGGKNSSNTKELFNKCSTVCKNTYFFSELDEFKEFIKSLKYDSNTKIGFTGGASTMKEQIFEFAKLLEK